jgi:hypothetical protein
LSAPKKQQRYYSGKQRCHTLKAQVLVDLESEQIICTAIETGRTHDFKLLKRSRLLFVSSQLCLPTEGTKDLPNGVLALVRPPRSDASNPDPLRESSIIGP